MPGLFSIVAVAVPNPPPQAPPGLESFANEFLGWMKWSGLVAGMAGLIIIGIMMAVGRRNRSMMAVDGAAGIPWVVGGLTVISFASAIVGKVLS
jgi:drug/metabolite transporter (DMT)-like permease